MKKSDWESIRSKRGDLFLLDLEQLESFPIGRIASHPGTVAASVSFTGEKVQMTIYREDPGDDPFPINTDSYTIWESFPSHILTNRDEMIRTADTNADLNFQRYEEDHIFIIKEDAGQDHWLKELPSCVVALVKFEE
jgi:hypothetical protein